MFLKSLKCIDFEFKKFLPLTFIPLQKTGVNNFKIFSNKLVYNKYQCALFTIDSEFTLYIKFIAYLNSESE